MEDKNGRINGFKAGLLKPSVNSDKTSVKNCRYGCFIFFIVTVKSSMEFAGIRLLAIFLYP